jgi:hypothetical protein
VSTGDGLRFYVSTGVTDTERMRITSDGDVGIGTLLPQATLDVDGDFIVSGESRIASSTFDGDISFEGKGSATGDDRIIRGSNAPFGGGDLTITAGALTSGVTNGTAGHLTLAGGTIAAQGGSRYPGSIFLHTNNIERMRVSSSGYVGINTITTGPLDVFQVGGDIRVGTGSTGCVKDADATPIAGTCSSDIRLKKNIQPLIGVLDKVKELQPASFNWRSEEFPEYGFGRQTDIGLIAQDVEKVMPDLVSVDERGYKTVNYSQIPLLTLQALREQQIIIENLEARIKILESK